MSTPRVEVYWGRLSDRWVWSCEGFGNCGGFGGYRTQPEALAAGCAHLAAQHPERLHVLEQHEPAPRGLLTMAHELIRGTCDGGDCDRPAASLAFDWNAGLIPVCRRHITVYRALNGKFWQAEDEYAHLRFCRRSRFKWLAQWKILLDQRAAMNGRTSRGQARKIRHADCEATR